MIYPSTFSVVAYDPQEQAWGVAVASKFPAVGAVVPWAKAGAGAIATQSFANTSYGPRGIAMLSQGVSAQDVLDQLLSDDPEASHRQVGIVDASGNAATFTGSACFNWAGGITGNGFAIQGNILAGEQVPQAMAQALQTTGGDLAARLYAALFAGDRAGGDRRGRQSAAILVVKPNGGYGGFNDRWLDYRVDDDTDPVKRLGELIDMHRLYFGKSPESERVKLAGNTLHRMQRLLKKMGYYQGEESGEYDAATRAALEAMTGNENFEDRVYLDSGEIDPPVLDFLFQRFGE